MKKIIFGMFTFLVLAFGSAHATEVSVEVGSQTNSVTKQIARSETFRLQEGKIGVQLVNGRNIDRVEVDYTIQPFTKCKEFTVAVGAGAVTGVGAVGHYTYSVEPRVSIAVTDKITVGATYKFRNDMQASINDRTNVVTASVAYKVIPSTSLIGKVETSKGDYRYNMASLGVTYSF